MAKVEALPYDDRTVYSVAAFNRGIGQWLGRLPTVWVEGEVTELRRHERWATVFFTLKDPTDGSCVGVTIGRGKFDALRLDLADGERVHVFGRPELYEQRADFKLRALTIERFGVGAHLAALERLKANLAAEGVFAVQDGVKLPPQPQQALGSARKGRNGGQPAGEAMALQQRLLSQTFGLSFGASLEKHPAAAKASKV